VELSGNHLMTALEQTVAEELARAARLRRMAGDLTTEARAIEAKYKIGKQQSKTRTMMQVLKDKGLA
jgi:hypothetical protein